MNVEITRLRSFGIHLVVAGLVTAGALLLSVAVAVFAPTFIGLSRMPLDGSEARSVAERLLFLHEHFWPIAAACIVGVSVSSLVILRRLLGPVGRLREVFHTIAAGTLPEAFSVRDSDYLAGEVEVLNEMLTSLRQRVTAVAASTQAVGEGCDALAKLAGESDSEALRKAADEIESAQHALEEAVSAFGLEG